MISDSSLQSVLVVDQDIIIRSQIAEYLRGCGYAVIEAGSPGEAMVILQQSGRTVDMVLVELNPSGAFAEFALAQWVRKNCMGTEVFLSTSPEKTVKDAAELCAEGPGSGRKQRAEPVLDRIKRLVAARQRNLKDILPVQQGS